MTAEIVSAAIDTEVQPDWTEVESSNVHSVRYETDTKDLYVRFIHGGTYKYSKVDDVVYTDLIHSDSVGKYLNTNIKPFHSYELVTL